MFNTLFQRKRRMAKYQAIRARLESMSEADLADAGLKRYQLGAAARVSALKD